MKRLLGIAVFCVMLAVTVNADAAKIKWYTYKDGFAVAQAQDKKIFLFFQSRTCKYCELMKKKVFTKRKIISYLNEHFVSIGVSLDTQKKIAEQYGVRPIPDSYFLTPDGTQIGRRLGYVDAKNFLKYLEKVNAENDTAVK